MHRHIYTPEEREFFKEYIPGHTYGEIRAEFIARFGWGITAGQIKGYMGKHKMNNGLTGRFPKGHVPANKGKKGECAAGSEKGWFKKGSIPANKRPVGSERVSKDGYIEVKVAEPNKWRLKHRIAWEAENGKIPEGKCVLFLNGEKTDVRLCNLVLADRRVHVRMIQAGLRFENADITRAAVNLGELLSALGDAKRRKNHK